jgi:hypothetical protein
MVTNDTIYAWVAFVPGWCGSNLDPFAPEIDSTGGPTSTFEMTGLTASNLYCYAVEAWNGTTPSPLAWVNETYPAVPSNVSVVVGGSYANMTYTAPLGLVEGYELLVYPATTYPWCGFAYNISYVVRPIQNGPGFNAGPVETYLNATGLLPDTSYCGLLSASNYSGDAFAQLFDGISCMPLGCNAIAAQVNFTTAAPSLPGAPTNLVALAATSSEIDLSWTNPSGNLTDTHVYEYAGPSCIGSPIAFWDYGSSVPNLNWGGLAADTTYGFEVTASTNGGEGPPSACANATTTISSPPSAPTGLAATTISDSEVALSWTNPSGNLTDTHVYEYAGPSCIGSPTAFWDYGSSVPNLNWGGLAADTTYGFEVTASTNGGEGPPSACANATTTISAPPSAPTGLTATAISDSEVALSWTNPSGTLTDTHVYEYAGPSCLGSPMAFWDYGSSVPNLNWGGLAADTTYGFEVTASTDGGEGPPSGCANATTLFVDTPWITGSAMHDSGGTRVTSALNLRSLQVYTGVTFILIVTVIPSVAFVSDRDRRPAADDNSWMVRKGGASSLPDGNDP